MEFENVQADIVGLKFVFKTQNDWDMFGREILNNTPGLETDIEIQWKMVRNASLNQKRLPGSQITKRHQCHNSLISQCPSSRSGGF